MEPETKEVRSLVCKLAEIVAEIDHVEKKGRNEFQKYSYVKAADLANAVRQKLSARKILLLSDVIARESVQVQAKDGGTWMFDNIDVLYTFYDGESGEKLCFKMPGTGADKGDKAVYKAITGSLKYALRNAFLVPDEAADPEADESTDKEAGKLAAAAVARSKAVSSVSDPKAYANVIFLKRDVLANSGPVLRLSGEPLANNDLVGEWNELFFANRDGKDVIIADNFEDDFRIACESKGLHIVESSLPETSGKGAGGPVSQAAASAPILKSCTTATTKKGAEYRKCTWGDKYFNVFDAGLFPFLDSHVGKPVELQLKQEGQYWALDSIPAIQRGAL